ncbi:MAG: hypothetical protein EZS28_022540, partial [Streblomastix strix]
KDQPPPIKNQNISEGFQQLVLFIPLKNQSERPSLDDILKHRIIQPFVSGISQRKISISKIKEKKKEKEKTKEKDKEEKKEMEKNKEIIEQKGFDKEKKVKQERDGKGNMEDASEEDIYIDNQEQYIPSIRNFKRVFSFFVDDDINKMEEEFLNLLNFNLQITSKEYLEYYFSLRELGGAQVKIAFKRLDEQKAALSGNEEGKNEKKEEDKMDD